MLKYWLCGVVGAFSVLNVAGFKAAAKGDAQNDSATLSGAYELITIRRASDAAGGAEDASLNMKLGERIEFQDNLSWLGGVSCHDWRLTIAPSPVVTINDPILSDTQIGPVDGPRSSGDKVVNRHLNLRCGDDRLGAFTQIDDRILIAPTPSGLSYLIFEKPLARPEITRLQEQLSTMKFFDGEAGDKWTDASLLALSSYADYRGSEYRFARTAISENLLDGLDILARDPEADLIKLVYAGEIAAYFYGEQVELSPSEFGVRWLSFRFKNEPRERTFVPEGELFNTDWRFDIFSPDLKFVALQQDHYGPLHIIRTEHLKDYLEGMRQADFIVADGEEDHKAVVDEVRWNADGSLTWHETCCGEVRKRTLAPPNY